jgi:predicted AAA+ superfamily ATPase
MKNMTYIPRQIEPKLTEYLEIFPVVGLTGPRQSGKSTLLLEKLKDYEYVTFDDFRTINFLKEDPEGFINRYKSKVIFDEVQKAPEIFNLIKVIVDQNRDVKGQFVLTGSSDFHVIKNVSETLAGRIGLLSLLPLQFNEIPENLRLEAQWKGSYPELVTRAYKNRDDWYSSYISTYINKDVREISQIGDLADFQRLMKLLAANTSHVVNLTDYSRDIGVSVPTIKRWLSVLEASYIIFLLPPFYGNYEKRIVKSPKVYFYDTGIVSHLVGIETDRQYNQGPMAGALFENYVIAETLKKNIHLKTMASLYFILTSNKVEVDLIVTKGLQKEFIEIKKSQTFKPSMIKPMQSFMEENDTGFLVYNGKTDHYDNKIKMLPFSEYLK